MENRKPDTGNRKPVIASPRGSHFSFPVFGFLLPVFHSLRPSESMDRAGLAVAETMVRSSDAYGQ
jgi:hypothetical protein